MSISGVGSSSQYVRSFQPPSFSTLDSDSSGGISLQELEAAAPGGTTDSNSTERTKKLFSQMDADGNGSVSSDEKSAFDKKIDSQRQAMQFMAQILGSSQQQTPSNDDVFAATDTNSDGSVSLDEFSSSSSASGVSSSDLSTLFGLIDSNADGSISSTESSDFLDTIKQAVGGPPGGPQGGRPPGPPPGPPPQGSDSSSTSDSSTDSSTSATVDLLSAATSAYSKKSQQSDLLSTLTSLLQKAA